jgi:hypothetical protein
MVKQLDGDETMHKRRFYTVYALAFTYLLFLFLRDVSTWRLERVFEQRVAAAAWNTPTRSAHGGGGAHKAPTDVTSRIDFEKDMQTRQQRFLADSQFLYELDFLPPDVVQTLRDEVAPLRHLVHRNGGFALHKQGGSLSYWDILDHCPAVFNLYNSDELLNYVRRVTGVSSLVHSPKSDPHSAAVYWYDRPDDHVHWHWDTSWFRGVRYTMLLPLVEDSSMLLEVRIPNDNAHALSELATIQGNPDYRAAKPTMNNTRVESINTQPGAAVLFLGDGIRHRVTTMDGPNQQRQVITFEFVSSFAITPHAHFLFVISNAGGYFGFPIDLKICLMLLLQPIFIIASHVLLTIYWLLARVGCFGASRKSKASSSSSSSCLVAVLAPCSTLAATAMAVAVFAYGFIHY